MSQHCRSVVLVETFRPGGSLKKLILLVGRGVVSAAEFFGVFSSFGRFGDESFICRFQVEFWIDALSELIVPIF